MITCTSILEDSRLTERFCKANFSKLVSNSSWLAFCDVDASIIAKIHYIQKFKNFLKYIKYVE